MESEFAAFCISLSISSLLSEHLSIISANIREMYLRGQDVELINSSFSVSHESNNATDESIRAPDRNSPRIIAETHQEGFARLHRHRICPAFSPNLPTLVQAASSGWLARRNVNTDRPISLIGPIRSNARHSPTLYTVAVRHGGVPESRHCSYGRTCAPYVHPRVCTDMHVHAGRFEKSPAFRTSRLIQLR